MQQGVAIVVDIGKTLSKVSLWSRGGRMPRPATRAPMPRRRRSPMRRLDTARDRRLADRCAGAPCRPSGRSDRPGGPRRGGGGHSWRRAGLRAARLRVGRCPPRMLADYRAARDPFARNRLACPARRAQPRRAAALARSASARLRGATLMPYAQYWAWLLSGRGGQRSHQPGLPFGPVGTRPRAVSRRMAERRGWAALFAPLARAGDAVGTLRPELAAAHRPVAAGAHPRRAARFQRRAARRARLCRNRRDHEATVLSTGTWFVAMRLGRQPRPIDIAALPEARDCLVNVDVEGRPVPSARFMGGREIEACSGRHPRIDIRPDQPAWLAAVPRAGGQAMVLPTLRSGLRPVSRRCGPAGSNRPEDWIARRAAAVPLRRADGRCRARPDRRARNACWSKAGSPRPRVFVRALASAAARIPQSTPPTRTDDVSFGALRLI